MKRHKIKHLMTSKKVYMLDILPNSNCFHFPQRHLGFLSGRKLYQMNYKSYLKCSCKHSSTTTTTKSLLQLRIRNSMQDIIVSCCEHTRTYKKVVIAFLLLSVVYASLLHITLFYGTSPIPLLLTDKEDFAILSLKAQICTICSKRLSGKRG